MPRPRDQFVLPLLTRERPRPSAVMRIIITASTFANSWYFRFHIRDTYLLAFHDELTSYYNPIYLLSTITIETY